MRNRRRSSGVAVVGRASDLAVVVSNGLDDRRDSGRQGLHALLVT